MNNLKPSETLIIKINDITTLESIAISESISVAKITTVRTNESGKVLSEMSRQGVFSNEELLKLDDGKIPVSNGITIVTQENLDEYQSKGPLFFPKLESKIDSIKSPYDHICRGLDFVAVEYIINSFMIKDALDGSYYPVALTMDYMEANLHNGEYHLDMAIDILKKRKDVRFISGYDTQSIPDYSCVKHATEFLRIQYCPDKVSYNKIISQSKSYGKSDYSTEIDRAIFDIDALGLVAGGATKNDKFFEYT